jgi:hypothetical protein
MPLVRRPLARAAIVGGGAYAAGRRRAEAEQQQAPAAAAAPEKDVVAKLKELQELQASGALTPEEFEAAKQKLLQGQ